MGIRAKGCATRVTFLNLKLFGLAATLNYYVDIMQLPAKVLAEIVQELNLLKTPKKQLTMENKNSNGINFTGLLLIAFIVLKLCNVITWSWIWVLSPFWIPVALLILVIPFLLYYKQKNKSYKPKTNEKNKWQQRMEEILQQKQKN